jgi:uncharacterized membrane protein YgaE (UPF0421/DUF939 family)
MSVNHGTQARKDIEVMRQQVFDMRENNEQTLKNLNSLIQSPVLENKQTKNELNDLKEQMTEVAAYLKAQKQIQTAKKQAEDEEKDKLEKDQITNEEGRNSPKSG